MHVDRKVTDTLCLLNHRGPPHLALLSRSQLTREPHAQYREQRQYLRAPSRRNRGPVQVGAASQEVLGWPP